MLILPAIDLYEKCAVRLYKGNYDEMTVYSRNPLEIAQKFQSCGAEYIHMVDLDGAKKGEKTNAELFVKLARTTNVPIELGGGIRNMETVEFYLDNGISRVILGSAALHNKDFCARAVDK